MIVWENNEISKIDKNYWILGINKAKFWHFSEDEFSDYEKFRIEYGNTINFIITSDKEKISELEEIDIFADEITGEYHLFRNIKNKFEKIFSVLCVGNPYPTQTLFIVTKNKKELTLDDFIYKRKKWIGYEYFVYIPEEYGCFVFEWDFEGVNYFFNTKV
jgi:hypothetical protein